MSVIVGDLFVDEKKLVSILALHGLMLKTHPYSGKINYIFLKTNMHIRFILYYIILWNLNVFTILPFISSSHGGKAGCWLYCTISA